MDVVLTDCQVNLLTETSFLQKILLASFNSIHTSSFSTNFDIIPQSMILTITIHKLIFLMKKCVS